MTLEFLISPIIGAAIGGITNGIAIRMLFRPLNPIKIGSYTLPFTPGVIPKEKKRMATKIGQVVSEELLNASILKEWLLKEEVFNQIEQSIKLYLDEQEQNEKTLYDQLSDSMGEERITFLTCEGEELLTDKLYGRLIKMDVGQLVGGKVKEAFREGAFSNILGPMSFLINEGLVDSLLEKIYPFINQFIEEEGEQLIRKAVEEESHNLLDTPIKEYAIKARDYEEVINHMVSQMYRTVVETHLPTLIAKLNIARIVEERIMTLDMLEIEKIILSIMKKELNAIIWLGVLLGGIIGLLANLL